MRTLIGALAMAAAAGPASALDPGGGDGAGYNYELSQPFPLPSVPSNAKKQAEEAVKEDLGDPNIAFRAERAHEVAQIRRSQFESPVDGPLAVVCGQYALSDGAGAQAGYSWFLVAIKRNHILWTTPDKPSDGLGEAYYSCKGAGLAN